MYSKTKPASALSSQPNDTSKVVPAMRLALVYKVRVSAVTFAVSTAVLPLPPGEMPPIEVPPMGVVLWMELP